MIKNYFKIAWRNLISNKFYSSLNIIGLATGMAVGMLIMLWVWNELSYNKTFKSYDRIAQVMQHLEKNGQKETQPWNPYPLAEEIRKNYPDDFEYVVQSVPTQNVVKFEDKKVAVTGTYFEPEIIEMLSMEMLEGSRKALADPYSILISEDMAEDFFGNEKAIDKILDIDGEFDVKVTGVFKNLPQNSAFGEVSCIMPWELYIAKADWIKEMDDPWRPNFALTYVTINANGDFDALSQKIKDVKLRKVDAIRAKQKPELFLHPMSKWHLYEEFENGVNTGGTIDLVWLFGLIGLFVLILACINFMNLSTARSEKRAKEVGIRKAIGSQRKQLVFQFFAESILVAFISFVIAIFIVLIFLPLFNNLADKSLTIQWTNPIFWLIGISFSLLTGVLAGSYPAIYLSSFQPVKVLKGTFKAGRFAAIPRKTLVVVQFTVSIALIVGTLIIRQQIQFAQDRPLGYEQDGLITLVMTEEINKNFNAFRNELKNSGIEEVAYSTGPPTELWATTTGISWKGQDANVGAEIPFNGVSFDYGKTIGWEIVQGRDFSREFGTDSTAFVINQAAADLFGFADPIGQVVDWDGEPKTIIGVIENMVVQSPYDAAQPIVTFIDPEVQFNINVKFSSTKSTMASLATVKNIYTKFSPETPFNYTFVDESYAAKFNKTQHLGKLTTTFAMLAIMISCLGLFGLASYMAQQRSKEIGVRKVLGATVTNLWAMLSKDFILLVLIATLIATPITWYFMDNWLVNFNYRTEIAWWIFAMSGAGALVITLLTVSYQSIKAALLDPVKSLRSE